MSNYTKPSHKRHKKTKADTARHAQRRLESRLGIEATELEIRQLTNRITRGEFGEPVLVKSSTRSWYLVEWKGQKFYALYQKGFTVTTIYPEWKWATYEKRFNTWKEHNAY